MKRVLIVSFFFPPANSIGAVRVGKFAKYLSEFGWKPVVLTAQDPNDQMGTLPIEMDQADIHRAPYRSLAPSSSPNRQRSDKPASTTSSSLEHRRGGVLQRAASAMLSAAKRRANGMLLWFPMLHELVFEPIGWYRPALKRGRQVLSDCEIDAIFSSYSPAMSHLVAWRLQRHNRLAWVAEFRDPWALNHNRRRNWLSDVIEVRLEKMLMARATALIGASEPISDSLSSRHRKRAVTLLNGFDEEDYTQTVPQTPSFTITYTGAFYPGRQSPDLLLRALRELKLEHQIEPGDIEVRVFGVNPSLGVGKLVKESGLEGTVTFYDRVPFKDSIARQQESTVLLLLKWDDPSVKGIYSGKLFEYLGAARPILAIGAFEDPYVDELITGAGVGVPIHTVAMLKDVLLRWLAEWHQTGQIASYWNPRPEEVKRYTRREQAKTLAALLDELSPPASEARHT